MGIYFSPEDLEFLQRFNISVEKRGSAQNKQLAVKKCGRCGNQLEKNGMCKFCLIKNFNN